MIAQYKKIFGSIFLCILMVSIDAKLTKAQNPLPSGYLSINTEIDSFYVVIDDKFKNAHQVANGDTISIKSGEHRIRLIKKNYRDLVTSIDIKPDTIKVLKTNLLPFRNLEYHKHLSSYPRIFWGAPIIIKSDPDAKLYVNNEFVGTGIAKIDTTGQLTIKSVLPSGETTTSNIHFDGEKNTYYRNTFIVKEIYNRPVKNKSRYLALLPGVSQIYQRDKLKGYLLLGASLISGGLVFKYQNDFSEKYDLFKSTRSNYESSTQPEEALRLGELARLQLKDANNVADKRDLMIYAVAGIYLFNLIDAVLKPKTGYRTKIELDPYIDFEKFNNTNKGISLSYYF